MLKYIYAMSIAFVMPAGATAQNLTGLCLDMYEGGCMDRYIPFYANKIGWCEETCWLENPVRIRNMDGTLYDYVCRLDWKGGNEYEQSRVIILRQGNSLQFITSNWTQPIVSCPS